MIAVLHNVKDVLGGHTVDQAKTSCHEDTSEQTGQGRLAHRGKDDDHERREKRDRADPELGLHKCLQGLNLYHVKMAAGILEADENRDSRHDDVGRAGRPAHSADMLEEVVAGNRRSQVRRIGERGHLVAEIGAGNDDAGCQRLRNAKSEGDAHQSDADRAGSSPGGAGSEGNYGADDQRGEQEDRGAENVQAVINHAGHDASRDPGTD